MHGKRIPTLFGGPEALRDHRNAAGHLQHLDDSGYGIGADSIEGPDRRTEQRRPPDQCHEHAGQHDVQRELRAAVHLRGHIHSRRLVANQFEFRRILERHLFGYG